MIQYYCATLKSDGSGRAVSLLVSDQPPKTLPAGTVALTAEQYDDWLANYSSRAWVGGALTTVSAPIVPWDIPKMIFVERLGAAGKLRDAYAGLMIDVPLNDPSMTDITLLRRERYNAAVSINSADPDVIAFLGEIGADPAVILAPSTS